jgi:AbrB family looped-hinge helix DNA binding protein
MPYMSKITSKYQLTIPKAVAERAGYQPGDEVECDAAGELIRIRHKARQNVASVSTTDRIILFDLATERQAHRQRLLSNTAGAESRGWTRDELYE